MIRHAKRFVKRTFHNLLLSPEGEKTIERVGHREYVGGQWDTLGTLQFNFLVERGMRPEHYLLDVACGALRLGVRAIPYLDEGHYLGIEKEEKLVKAGLEDELPQSLRALKKPNIVVSSEFEFEKLGRQADFAMAQSLFSHLTADAVRKCLERAFPAMRAGGEFYGNVLRKRAGRPKPRDIARPRHIQVHPRRDGRLRKGVRVRGDLYR